MIKGSTNKNQRKEDKSQKDKVRIYSPDYFFLCEAKRKPRRGTTTAKTSPPPGDGSGTADNGAAEEVGAGAVEEAGAGAMEEARAGAVEELRTGGAV